MYCCFPSMHDHDEIDAKTDAHKPVIITDYNSTKGGVDTVDKLSASYNCSRNLRQMTNGHFYSMLNIAGINSQVIYASNNPRITILRRNFLRQLANDFLKPHLEVRSAMNNISQSLRLTARTFWH
ncbi:hypothetical protein NQ314_018939 [Rhamnusium bicolor]|uniref:PiggyBac transposable element-derived protein domain-containing protein n=1 Tax=Rhamnusium bicolor TaxID=1586634 RepID=A0AAV8WPR4_9CUCU|nr:hypothetical protein NQ314_018939 [Rhamnusium bicolor]